MCKVDNDEYSLKVDFKLYFAFKLKSTGLVIFVAKCFTFKHLFVDLKL